MNQETSIIIPYHQEGLPFILDTIDSIKDTIDIPVWEIVVVDDGSRIPLKLKEGGVRVIRHKNNIGVGAAFDTGVKHAKYDNLFLMGSDVRFIPNHWASLMVKEIEEYPKAITCSTCVGINEQDMDIEKRRHKSRRNGSTILLFHDHKTHPKKPANFRNILECQWLPLQPSDRKGSWEIPCILGAFYGCKKEWYEYLDGFAFHRSWGTLEPTIGLKSWLFGGSNRTTADVQTGHIFKPAGTHGTQIHHLTYNKMVLSTLLFNEYDAQRLIQFLGSNPHVLAAKQMFNENRKEIMKKRAEYEKKIVVDIRDWVKRWDVDFREDS